MISTTHFGGIVVNGPFAMLIVMPSKWLGPISLLHASGERTREEPSFICPLLHVCERLQGIGMKLRSNRVLV